MTDKVHISPQGVESVLLKARKRTSNVDQRKNFRGSHGFITCLLPRSHL